MKRTALLLLRLPHLWLRSMPQTVEHPDKGSAERSALLETLRPPVEKRAKQKIVFVIITINVQSAHGRLSTAGCERPTARCRSGKLRHTPRPPSTVHRATAYPALLKRSGRLASYNDKSDRLHDVCYVDWWKRYKAPKAIFPYTE